MPDVSQIGFPGPVAVPPARVDVGGGGASTSVFSGGPGPPPARPRRCRLWLHVKGCSMPDVSQIGFPGPVAVPPARVDVGGGGASTSVFSGGPAPTWMNLLPPAPGPNDQLQGQRLQLQIQKERESRN